MDKTINPIQCLSDALGHSIHSDIFNDILYYDKNWDFWHTLSIDEKVELSNSTPDSYPALWIKKYKSPQKNDIKVFSFFIQKWNSSGLGFVKNQNGEQTEAYTIVLKCEEQYAVYFDGTFAYCIDKPTSLFFNDVKNQFLKSVFESYLYRNNINDLESTILRECSHLSQKISKIVSLILVNNRNHTEEIIHQHILNLINKGILKINGSTDFDSIRFSEIKIN